MASRNNIERAPDLGCFLAEERRVHGQLALSLEGDAIPVDRAREDHEAKELAELVCGEADVGG
ncbi:MAG TPA: hypothetical protein VGJ67_01660, partial [Actinomycetota bacterium]